MKIDYISDTHLDFWCKQINTQHKKFSIQLEKYIKLLQPNYHDLLIIAGDIGHYFKQDKLFLLELKKYYTHICIVPGNHDMYLVSKRLQQLYNYDSINRLDELANFCYENEGFHYLDEGVISIDGLKVAGLGMHWDTSYANKYYPEKSVEDIISIWNSTMNDSSLIFNKKKNLSKASFDPIKYFNSEYKKLQEFENCQNIDIMVTHYGPKVPDNLPLEYKNIVTTFYYFDGEEDIKRISPRYWIYGHTHKAHEETYHYTDLLCNPVGYPSEVNDIRIRTLNY